MRGSFTPFIILAFIIMVGGELAVLPLVLEQQKNETQTTLATETYLVELQVETFEVAGPAKTGGPCGDDTFGYGITYGPRGARQALLVWPCETPVLEATQYGEPVSDLDSTGPVINQAAVDLPPPVVEWLLDQLAP